MEQGALMNMISSILDWAYDKAITGVPGLDSAGELADEYRKKEGTLEERIDALIKWQSVKCATAGFLTNVGGILSIPVGLSANLTSVIFMQLRMVAAIADLKGYNLHDERVKAMAMVCLCGKSANELVKGGIKAVGRRLLVREVPKEAIKKSQASVSAKLASKIGVNAGSRVIPIASGVISGLLDAAFTRGIGEIAKKAFEDIHDEMYVEFREIKD